MAAVPLVVLTNIEQHRAPLERRRNLADLCLRHVHLIHVIHAVTATTRIPPRRVFLQHRYCCDSNFPAIHNFHRFIHRPPAGETRFEPVNLCVSWKLLWITLLSVQPPIAGLTLLSEMSWSANL